jgi:hypothetical protein
VNAYILNDRILDPVSAHISSYFCQLFILIDADHIQYGLLDSDHNKFIALADFKLHPTQSGQKPSFSHLEEFIRGEELLNRKYPSVLIGMNTPYHTLVPSPLFDQEQISNYLGFNFKLPENLYIQPDKVEEIDAYNIAGFDKHLVEFITGKFSNAALVHASTAVIKTAGYHHKQSPAATRLFLHLRDGFIDLVLFEGKKLVLFNSFPCRTKEDVLYFTLYTVEHASVDLDKLNLSLSGFIDEASDTYRLLAQYFGKMTFADRLVAFNYSALLEQLPSWRYQDLFALALCG